MKKRRGLRLLLVLRVSAGLFVSVRTMHTRLMVHRGAVSTEYTRLRERELSESCPKTTVNRVMFFMIIWQKKLKEHLCSGERVISVQITSHVVLTRYATHSRILYTRNYQLPFVFAQNYETTELISLHLTNLLTKQELKRDCFSRC